MGKRRRGRHRPVRSNTKGRFSRGSHTSFFVLPILCGVAAICSFKVYILFSEKQVADFEQNKVASRIPKEHANHWETIAVYPHDAHAFTQGLEIHKGDLFESTGLYGKSQLRKVDLETGKIAKQVKLKDDFFGEGLTIFGDKIFLLTWRESTCFIFNASTLEEVDRFSFHTTRNEGWGIALDGEGNLIVSDGSSFLHIWDIESKAELRKIQVFDPSRGMETVQRINELEYAPRFDCILANIWYADDIVCIDTRTGRVKKRFNLTDLYPRSNRPIRSDCLNGIAVTQDSLETDNLLSDRVHQDVLLTGKFWDKLFHVRLWSG